MRHLIGWLALALALAFTTVAAAGPADPARADELADQLESPFCPGRTLSSCTSPAAAKWRIEIDEWVKEGVSSDEIRRRLNERAGRDLMVVPKNHTFYGLLALSVLLSIGVTGFAIRALRPRHEESDDQADEPPRDEEEDDELDQRLDDELALVD